MVLRETGKNAYAKFWRNKQTNKQTNSIMVFLIMANCRRGFMGLELG